MDAPSFAEENPYTPENHIVPFSGRENAFAHLQHHLNNPPGTPAALFYGRTGIGKTAFINQVPLRFEEHYVVVNILLTDDTLQHDDALMQAIAYGLVEAVEARGFIILDPLALPESNFHDWLVEAGLPALCKAIRPQRRFVLLFDDAQNLLQAIDGGRISVTIFEALQTLLLPQLGIGLTVDESYEGALDLFTPLTGTEGARRLNMLSDEALREVLLRPVHSQYTLTDDALDSVCMATGGDPAMVQRYGFYIYERATDKRDPFSEITINADDIKAIHDQIYAEWSPIFQQHWQAITSNERLFLNTAAYVYYDNPVRDLSIDRMVAWLLETEHPLDSTALSAVFRGLDYQGFVRGTASNVRFTSTLMRRWVLDKARLTVPTRTKSPDTEETHNINLMWVAVLVLIVVVGIVLALSIANGGTPDAVPTLPLVPT